MNALLKGAGLTATGASAVHPETSPTRKPRTKVGICPELPTSSTVWVCSLCKCPHNNPNKIVCRWCGNKKAIHTDTNTVGAPTSTASPGSVTASPSLPRVVIPPLTPGPIDKPWMKKILGISDGNSASTLASSPCSNAASYGIGSGGAAMEDGPEGASAKRESLLKMLSDAKESSCGDELVRHIQKECTEATNLRIQHAHA